MEVHIRRPVKIYGVDFEANLEPDSWFEENKYATLRALTIGSDDLRFNRQMAVSMLSEAWDSVKFKRECDGADDVDRLFQIIWLQHWSTFIGLLTAGDVETIRFLNENGHGHVAERHFNSMVKQNFEPEPLESVSQRTRSLASTGKLVGVFLGTFAPPTYVHLSITNYYRQFCDVLVIGMDGDRLAVARKGMGRDRYPYASKYSVWRGFPNVADEVVEVPENIYMNGQYQDANIVAFYKQLGAGIVFFNRSFPGQENREAQIAAAGAISYDAGLYDSRMVFSSSQLMALKESGNEMFASVLGKFGDP
ncbi:MAG: hypothetical protein AAB860_00400 [Patescibacteria group bacterium]